MYREVEVEQSLTPHPTRDLKHSSDASVRQHTDDVFTGNEKQRHTQVVLFEESYEEDIFGQCGLICVWHVLLLVVSEGTLKQRQEPKDSQKRTEGTAIHRQRPKLE